MVKKYDVFILMGSDSDLPTMRICIDTLKEFGVNFDVKVLSAHRSPDAVLRFAKQAKKNEIKVIIAAAGGAAHLAGVLASHTTLPVIGVPMETKTLKGIDSLLSTVQMPSGIPVATVAIGSAGAKNAAILAVQVLGLSNRKLSKKLETFKKKLAESILQKNKNLKF